MLPDDPRHGTVAGQLAHRKASVKPCEPCRVAWNHYEKRRRFAHARGRQAIVPAHGTKRRLMSLCALGWTMFQIDQELGKARTYCSALLAGADTVFASTAADVAAVYERLCMTRPEGWVADRTRREAAAREWAPPLAWTNIDDLDEQPRDWHYREPDRADMLADLIDQGAGISDACRVLRVSRKTLERWCERNDLRGMYVTLTAREHVDQVRANQWTKEGAA